jgi:hypothetical protein
MNHLALSAPSRSLALANNDAIERILVGAPLSAVAALALSRLDATEPADQVLSYLEPVRDPSGAVVGFLSIPCAA